MHGSSFFLTPHQGRQKSFGQTKGPRQNVPSSRTVNLFDDRDFLLHLAKAETVQRLAQRTPLPPVVLAEKLAAMHEAGFILFTPGRINPRKPCPLASAQICKKVAEVATEAQTNGQGPQQAFAWKRHLDLLAQRENHDDGAPQKPLPVATALIRLQNAGWKQRRMYTQG